MCDRKIHVAISIVLCSVANLLAAPADRLAASGVAVAVDSGRARIGNGLLRLEIASSAARPRATVVENLRARKRLSMAGEDFILELSGDAVVRSSELAIEGAREEVGEAGAKRLVLDYAGEGLRVSLVTEMTAEQPWATRWLEIRAAGKSGSASRRLAGITLARWECSEAIGPPGPGATVPTLGAPSGVGQAVYAGDLFFAIAHPGAENFAADGRISCRITACAEIAADGVVRTRPLVVGAGETGGARRALLEYVDATRPVPARMVFLVNDWYWKDKSRPLEAFRALVRVKKASGIPVDSFTLDDGWDFDWDREVGIWGRLNRQRFPGGWDAFRAIGREADIDVSLWFGPIGGYTYRPKRLVFARTVGYEIQRDRLCLVGPRYRKHVEESFARWAQRGMDYIKVDGFWPDCQVAEHGHPVGAAGTVAQMDALMDVFAAWRQGRPNLMNGYTSGSNPSPFWLQHADWVWRGGRDDSHAGAGAPFDRHNTYLDICLERHRQTDMPISAFVTFDVVQDRIAGNSDEVFERGCWWLAARTSLHHDWYVQASDLSIERWKTLGRVSRWAKGHEKLFRWSRMVGGDPGRGEIYGFSAYDSGRGTLALRNPDAKPRVIESSLATLLELAEAARGHSYRLRGVFGETSTLEGVRPARATLRVELPPLTIAVVEVDAEE